MSRQKNYRLLIFVLITSLLLEAAIFLISIHAEPTIVISDVKVTNNNEKIIAIFTLEFSRGVSISGKGILTSISEYKAMGVSVFSTADVPKEFYYSLDWKLNWDILAKIYLYCFVLVGIIAFSCRGNRNELRN